MSPRTAQQFALTLAMQELVAVGSSSSAQIQLCSFAHELNVEHLVSLRVIRSLDIPEGMRALGLTFPAEDRLLLLGGKRLTQSVLFSSLTAEQDLALYTFDLSTPVVTPSSAVFQTETLIASETETDVSTQPATRQCTRANVDATQLSQQLHALQVRRQISFQLRAYDEPGDV